MCYPWPYQDGNPILLPIDPPSIPPTTNSTGLVEWWKFKDDLRSENASLKQKVAELEKRLSTSDQAVAELKERHKSELEEMVRSKLDSVLRERDRAVAETEQLRREQQMSLHNQAAMKTQTLPMARLLNAWNPNLRKVFLSSCLMKAEPGCLWQLHTAGTGTDMKKEPAGESCLKRLNFHSTADSVEYIGWFMRLASPATIRVYWPAFARRCRILEPLSPCAQCILRILDCEYLNICGNATGTLTPLSFHD